MNTYISPTGTIELMTGLNLNPNQEDTLYFTSAAERDVYMGNFVGRRYEAQSYSRPSRGVVRVLDTIGVIYPCNYMRFKNGDGFEGATTNQWIYAFVLQVEYVNNNTCDVFYEIDDLITWLPYGKLKECFVEREIPETDGLYQNLVPESLETGEYITTDEETVDFSNNMCIVLCTTTDAHGNIYDSYTNVDLDNVIRNGTQYSAFVNGLLSFLHFTVFDANTPQDIERVWLHIREYQHNGYADNIVSIQYMPKICADKINSHGFEEFDYDILRPTRLDDYVPKNKKMLTAPYCVCTVSNNAGQVTQYNFEDFPTSDDYSSHYVKFKILGTAYGSPSLFCYPKRYAGKIDNYDAGIALTNFPTVPWQNDAYQAYMAQNKASLTTGILCTTVAELANIGGTLASAAIGVASGSAVGSGALGGNAITQFQGTMSAQKSVASGGSSILNSAINVGTKIAQTMAKIEDAKAIPNTVHGQVQTDGLNLAIKRIKYDINVRTIRYGMAKIIDDYFSMYGYAQHKVKVPNIKSRPYWNYTKTQGCVITGSIPASSKRNISALFDRGIRFWKANDYIGNYNLNNSPT